MRFRAAFPPQARRISAYNRFPKAWQSQQLVVQGGFRGEMCAECILEQPALSAKEKFLA
jgi:hypothetical protein